MKSLLIVYHSQSGTCAHLARAACRGAELEPQIEVVVLRAWDAGTADLARADGLLLVMAENSAALCGAMKDFLDRTFYPAIERGLARFEPGTQGEHKVPRGFEPVQTWSAHWIAEPRFHRAIETYLDEERAAVDQYIREVRQHVPFRRAGSPPSGGGPPAAKI